MVLNGIHSLLEDDFEQIKIVSYTWDITLHLLASSPSWINKRHKNEKKYQCQHAVWINVIIAYDSSNSTFQTLSRMCAM